MIHLQRTVPNWLEAVRRLPDKALVKSVDNGQVFQEVKVLNPNIYTCLRHWYDPGQVFGGTYEENKTRAHDFFETFIDGTFISQIAPYCDFIEEWNEYLANSQNANEIADRIMWAEAAADVWSNEYRNRPELAHIRLVLCNTAVGNSIAEGFFEIARDYNCLIGYHPYTYWSRGVRGSADWATLSGLWAGMEQRHGIKVDWLFSEAGPFEGALDGWRSPNCLGADRDKYVEAVRLWIRDVQQTDAYREGRIFGFALYTTGRAGDVWKHFWTEQPELNMLADMIREEWKPGVYVPPPPPPTDEGRGKPRVQYARTYHRVSVDATDEQYLAICLQARQTQGTVGGSVDDACIGDLDSRTMIEYGDQYGEAELNRFRDSYYPGVNIIYKPLPTVDNPDEPNPEWLWPVDNELHTINDPFDAPRSRYIGNHEGSDLFAKFNDPILAARDGDVIWASNRRRADGSISKYGNHVVIDHGQNYISWSAHLESYNVQAGDVVLQGDIIGRAGSTGNSTGVHLHFSIQHIGHGLDGYILRDVVDPGPLLGV